MVNSTYIANATDFFDRATRFSSETGYLFGHGIVILVALVAAWRTSQYGITAASTFAGFFSFLAALFLTLGGLESWPTVIFCGSFTLMSFLLGRLSKDG